MPRTSHRLGGNPSQGWRIIGKQKAYFRSIWEANYARVLEYLKNLGDVESWEHEPKTFWFEAIKRGVRSYLPDFRVNYTDGSHVWVEVKGWMDPKSLTKIKRFRKYYPEEPLVVISEEWYRKNKNMRLLIPDWETGGMPRSPYRKIIHSIPKD
jgi:predicted nuclease of restriction endonuclease-like RecB superfamily